MGDSDSVTDGIIPVFLGALQASLTVLLTISYGVIASRYNLLKESSTRDISKTAVRLFLPALLITNVGEELKPDTAWRYVPVLIWALLYTLLSVAIGMFLKRAFKFPAWCVPAICFNNTTALPLLLIQALDTAGILGSLTMSDTDTASAALSRAKSYFLISSMVGNSLTFALGPKLLDDEEAPDELDEDSKADHNHSSNGQSESDEEYANPTNSNGRTAVEEEEYENETSTLLPRSIARSKSTAAKKSMEEWKKIPLKIRKTLSTIYSFINAPLLGALLGAILGLTPALHTAFFAPPSSGGIFKAWLTTSVKNIGELFAALQLVVVGAKLSSSLIRMKNGQSSGKVPSLVVLTICFIRFILWPLVSIGVIYVIARKTQWLDEDPILWFVLMLMPTGPPATKLTALADVSGADEEEKMAIAKFITVAYAVSPLICFAVVGSLKACLAAKG
ncbi:85924cf5-6cb7-48cf-93ff-e709b0871438 [Sclerotinia trifoliorum]|uniref:85924cf5-6cb7-48cf-93ff-e709b0871438 n=1 Tax=Sclerotinia trifoliorum TaxID=28548 RepID=A0A8H2VYR0_9HELO|nr:85924cf5-6cb7-48cf-93ff-e709b0871438 [Sclerotinia trifoliorum]